MTDASPQDLDPGLSGRRFLYTQPELLTPEQHGGLGLRTLEAPYAFAAEAEAVPLTVTEFRSAQRHFPIVFTGGEQPMPLAITGLGGRNLFVDEEGRWDPLAYVPAYLRCHPLALATAQNEQFAVVLDRSSPAVSEDPEVPFFENGTLTEGMRERIRFCQAYDGEVERTRTFCQRLRELDVLAMQSVGRDVEGQREDIARYGAVEPKRLQGVEAAALASLRDDGSLAAIFAHFFSLDLWNELLRRQAQRTG
jgi:hypothetical protein